jgi:hypothetical protein
LIAKKHGPNVTNPDLLFRRQNPAKKFLPNDKSENILEAVGVSIVLSGDIFDDLSFLSDYIGI